MSGANMIKPHIYFGRIWEILDELRTRTVVFFFFVKRMREPHPLDIGPL